MTGKGRDGMTSGTRSAAFGDSVPPEKPLVFGDRAHMVGQFTSDLVSHFLEEYPSAVVEVKRSAKSWSRYITLQRRTGRARLRVSDHVLRTEARHDAEILLDCGRARGGGVLMRAKDWKMKAKIGMGILRGWINE